MVPVIFLTTKHATISI